MEDSKDRFNMYLSTKRAVEKFGERETSGFSLWGTKAGFYDPNNLFSPRDLVGRANSTPGIYTEMRYSHDIISSVVSARVNAVSTLEYSIQPRDENPSPDAIMASEAVNLMFESMESWTLNTFLADVYNNVLTYGFSLYEIWTPVEGHLAGTVQLLSIAPYQVDRWELNETRDRLVGAWIVTDADVVMVPAEKLVWFGRPTFSGNFWGVSELRKIVALYTAYKEDLMNYLQLRKMQAGIFYFDEQEAGSTDTDWEIASDYLSQYHAGLTSPLIATRGLKPKFLVADQPGIDNSGMLQYFDTKIKQAMDSTLTTLGMTGVGSLALGKEFAIEDAVKFENHVYSFLDIFNGNFAPESRLLQTLVKIAGFDPQDAPEICLFESLATRQDVNIDQVLELLESQIVTVEELGDDVIIKLLEDAGIDTTYYKSQITE